MDTIIILLCCVFIKGNEHLICVRQIIALNRVKIKLKYNIDIII